jgi:hypothetical protein
MKLLSPVLSLFLIPLLVVLPLQAQLPAPEPGASALHVLLRGQTTAKANADAAEGLVVEVTDDKGSGVPDAAVAFRLPDAGATGTFTDGSHAAVVYTDAAGQAHSPAIRWSATPGAANLRITAAKGALHAGLLLEEIIQPVQTEAITKPPAPGTLPIAAPQVVVVSVPNPVLPNSPAPGRLVSDQPLLSPSAPGPAASNPPAVTKSGASPAPAPVPTPVVSITNKPDVHSHSNKKWLLLALIGVGAGVGVALAMKGKGAAPAATTTAPPIGNPTVSVGN